MENTKGLLVFCGIISALIFSYYFSPANLAWGDGTVTVSATVTTTVSCNLSATSTDFGQLTTSAVSTSSPDITVTMSCNDASGATLKVHDQGNGTSTGGLYSTTTTTLVTSTATGLAPGTAGYGIQATTNATGSGDTLTIDTAYNKSGDNVGALVYSVDQTLSSSASPISGRETVVKHKAAISGLTPAASDYSDTITYSCTGN